MPKVAAKVAQNMQPTEARSMDEFLKGENVYFYDATSTWTSLQMKGSEFEKVTITQELRCYW